MLRLGGVCKGADPATSVHLYSSYPRSASYVPISILVTGLRLEKRVREKAVKQGAFSSIMSAPADEGVQVNPLCDPNDLFEGIDDGRDLYEGGIHESSVTVSASKNRRGREAGQKIREVRLIGHDGNVGAQEMDSGQWMRETSYCPPVPGATCEVEEKHFHQRSVDLQ